ncbi:hypothetical protein ACWEGE_39110 [Amycolatopsis sp. NPDC004747]
MVEERISLVPSRGLARAAVPYVIDFNGQRRQMGGIGYRLGNNAFDGPVAHKVAIDTVTAARYLRRELEVAKFLETRGGELLSKCRGYDFTGSPASTVVTYRGRPLSELARDPEKWPLAQQHRRKIIGDLLAGVELLRVSSIVHGAIGMDTLHWDGSTLQIVDFGRAALRGEYPDGRPAHHGDDVLAVGRVVYHVHTGQPPPDDPAELRRQIEQVHDTELRDLLLNRDLVAGVDIDYVFAPSPDRRTTTRTLLSRLDKRPLGVRPENLIAQEQQVRAEFRALRERQAHFRAEYAAWLGAQRPIRLPSFGSAQYDRRPYPPYTPPSRAPYALSGPRLRASGVIWVVVLVIVAVVLLVIFL